MLFMQLITGSFFLELITFRRHELGHLGVECSPQIDVTGHPRHLI